MMLEGKVAVVTGSNSGIGLGIAEALAARGARVVPNSFTETEEAPITANAVCPAYLLTPLFESQIPDQMRTHGMDRDTVIREVMPERRPSKQFVTVGQVAGTVAFLCSEDAAQITGAAIPVDGGWTAL